VDLLQIKTITFVCQWNEGRSAHLELSVRHKLREMGSDIRVISAGLSQGGGVNPLRKDFLQQRGVPLDEIEEHRSTIFDEEHAMADIVLVAELHMKDELLTRWPELTGKVMTVRGFIHGFTPEVEPLTPGEARIIDSAGHSDKAKLGLYKELEDIANRIVERLYGNE